MDRFSESPGYMQDRDLEREAEIAADKADHERDANPQPVKVKPVRLMLSRRKGFKLQKQSLMVNGLPAVNCARPGKWGNPYKVGAPDPVRGDIETNMRAVELFRVLVAGSPKYQERAKNELRGKNLACFCASDQPCHCDVLLAIANE